MDKLPSNDPYRRLLAAWAAEMDDNGTTRPRQPDAPDRRKGSSTIRALREAAHTAAMSRWRELHAAWLIANDARKRERRASYDAQRDWKEAKLNRSEEAERRISVAGKLAACETPLEANRFHSLRQPR